MSLAMTKQEREAFLADVHVGVISIPEPGRGPLTVPVWYAYDRGGELRVVTARTSRKGQLLARADRFSLCAQTETPRHHALSPPVYSRRSIRGVVLVIVFSREYLADPSVFSP
jgi:nitroimidazol reductase NimA-like FMN-containing flavoprotein (pyridoxamine 5'-phosphate oxidase superfamily)